MSSKRRSGWYRVHTWWPVVAALCVIAIESSELGSTGDTSRPLRWLWEHLFGRISDYHWWHLHTVIRKTGHFVGYGIVGLTWLRALWRALPETRFFTDASLALLATAAFASADEWHQAFLPDRTSSPWDVLLDCCGSLALQLLVYLYWRTCRPKRLANHE